MGPVEVGIHELPYEDIGKAPGHEMCPRGFSMSCGAEVILNYEKYVCVGRTNVSYRKKRQKKAKFTEKVFDKYAKVNIMGRKHRSAGGKGEHGMRQSWGYLNSECLMQSAGEPSVFFAYSYFQELAMQIPIPAKLLISESP